MRRLGLVVVVAAGAWACNAVLGVDVCGKECASDGDCGSGFTCADKVCTGDGCEGGNPVGGGSSSGGQVSQSTGTSSSGGSHSGSTSSSSVTGTTGTSSSSSSGGGCAPGGMPAPAGTSCGSGFVCNGQGGCISGCFIGSQVVAAGPDPQNACRACVPAQSTTAWSNQPANTPCSDGMLCTDDACNGLGQCVSTPSCTGNANNRHCMANGTCGCLSSADCAPGRSCNNNVCQPCNTTTACGLRCGSCRDLPMSIGEGAYYTCAGPDSPLSTACVVNNCSISSANCNNNDGDRCEVDITQDDRHCAACSVICASGQNCDSSQCTCDNITQCPLGQTCNNGRCRCTADLQCPTGYHCNANGHYCLRGN